MCYESDSLVYTKKLSIATKPYTHLSGILDLTPKAIYHCISPGSEPYCPKQGRGHSGLRIRSVFGSKITPVFGPEIGPKSTRDSAFGSFRHDPKIGLNCGGIVKKWAFIDRSPTQNRASGGPSGSSRTSFRVLSMRHALSAGFRAFFRAS